MTDDSKDAPFPPPSGPITHVGKKRADVLGPLPTHNPVGQFYDFISFFGDAENVSPAVWADLIYYEPARREEWSGFLAYAAHLEHADKPYWSFHGALPSRTPGSSQISVAINAYDERAFKLGKGVGWADVFFPPPSVRLGPNLPLNANAGSGDDDGLRGVMNGTINERGPGDTYRLEWRMDVVHEPTAADQ